MKLGEYLEQENISIMEFALQVGVAQSTVYYLKNGQRQPSVDVANKIDEVTNGQVTSKDWEKKPKIIEKEGKKTTSAAKA